MYGIPIAVKASLEARSTVSLCDLNGEMKVCVMTTRTAMLPTRQKPLCDCIKRWTLYSLLSRLYRQTSVSFSRVGASPIQSCTNYWKWALIGDSD
jgi:hypothetical protein